MSSLEPKLYLRMTDYADRAVRFINKLTHTKGKWARQPFELRPWQEAIIRKIFGTVRDDGLRQYRTAFVFFPRKNGKTEIAASIALYSLLSSPEAGGEIYSAACDREQASLVFKVAAQMIRNNRELDQLCRITDSHRQIVYGPTNSTYRAIPADAPHAHGYNASVVIADELHAWRNRDLWDVLTTSFGAREQPLTIAITTAGYDRNSLCYQLYDYASKVRDGVIDDPTFLPIIYEALYEDDWTDEAVWHKANPALADFRSIDEMRAMFREAREVPARETVFRQLYLNQWVDSAVRWISSDAWNACQDEFDVASLAGCECYAGLDLAYRDDFAALVLLFIDGDNYKLVPFFWMPEEGKRDRNRHPISTWVKQGHIELSPGNSTDFGAIRRKFNLLRERFNIRKIVVDPWNARQLSGELIQDGFDVVDFQQTMKNFTEPTKEFEVVVKSGKLRHDGNPVMTWMVSNVMVETDSAGNYRPSKKKSTEKIDGAVSGIMALAVASSSLRESVYERRELLVL